jgi:hypothetical protein
MVQVKYNDGGCLFTLFNTFGVGVTKVNTDDEKSITISFNIRKAHTFLTLAWL